MVVPPAFISQPNSTPFSGFTSSINSIDSREAFRHPQPEFKPFGSFGEACRHFSGSPFSFDSSNGAFGRVESPFGKSNTEIFGQAPRTSNSWGAFGSSTAALGSTDASPSSCGGKMSTSAFQPASSQAPFSLFGYPSSEPPRSLFQPASSQAPCSLFGSSSSVLPRSPFQSAFSQAPGGSLFGPPSSEPPRFGFGKTTSTSQHGFQSTGISSSIPEAASGGVRCCNCKCNQPNNALAQIYPAAFPIVHGNTSEATQGTNNFISYPAFVTYIHPAAAANGAHSTNISTASCLFPSLSSCHSIRSPAPSFLHNTLAANQGAASEPTVFGKAFSNKIKVEETNYSSRVPKGLEIIVEKLGFNPWSKGKGIANEQDSESKDILPCEEAYKDEDIIALAEFAVEQQNALQKIQKLKFVSVVAACLEAVGGGRYHIVLEATKTLISFTSMPERFYAVVLRKGTERTNQLTLLEKWLGAAQYFPTSF